MQATTHHPPSPDSPRDSSARVLVVEDHTDSREALCALLEASGYRTLIAGNGREAIQAARDDDPDIIIMDIMMPEMDGFQAIRILREEMMMTQTPIIIVTAMDGALEEANRSGANGFVRKPIDTNVLVAQVEECLAEQRRADDPPPMSDPEANGA